VADTDEAAGAKSEVIGSLLRPPYLTEGAPPA
jgi:hypothetical protein